MDEQHQKDLPPAQRDVQNNYNNVIAPIRRPFPYNEGFEMWPGYAPAARNMNTGAVVTDDLNLNYALTNQNLSIGEKPYNLATNHPADDFSRFNQYFDSSSLAYLKSKPPPEPEIEPKQQVDNVGQKRKNTNVSDNDSSKLKKTVGLTAEEKKNNLRKNIRDVMNETQLDTNTIEAQREESERLARVAGQHKSIREIQKHITVNKQIIRSQSRIIPLLEKLASDGKECEGSIFHLSPKNDVNVIVEDKDIVKEDEETNPESCPVSTEKFTDIQHTPNTIDSQDSDLEKESSNECHPIPTDVVTIDDSSSDDDCILLSEEEEYNEGEDASNSGMHVNDTYNIPDELGRVVVNIGHPEGEDTVYLAPQISKIIKPHQIGGVRFLYDNIIESQKRFKKSSGFGCILAHSMGLGKTLQVVSFCDIFLRHTPARNVLCVMPINTLQNWLSEFNMWIPRSSDNEHVLRPRHFDIFLLNDQQKTLSARAKVILSWAKEGGVLLIGYELFRLLALKLIPARKKRNSRIGFFNDGSDASTDLIDSIHQALVKPGPDLVICDEGHRIKNSHAGISVALKQIRTRRRIVLTGYPLQNNLLEYWCMVDFVRPNYLGTRTEFCNMFERPIQNGQCVDSTPDDIKLMRYRAHVLHSLLVGFVQRRSHEVLHETLPEKLEYVILVRMTPFQRKLYDTFMTDVVRKKAFPNPLKAFAVCCKIWNHPDVLYNFLKKCETDLDLEIDEEPSKNLSNTNTTATTTVDAVTTTNPNASSSLVNNEKITANANANQHQQPNDAISVNSAASSSDLKTNLSFVTHCNGGESNVNVSNHNTTIPMPVSVPAAELKTNLTAATIADAATNIQPQSQPPTVKFNEANKRCNMSYYNMENDESFSNYTTDVKPNNFWLETTIPSKPCYTATMVQQHGISNDNLENATGSSEIVDLDTNEIKTIESDIHMKSAQQQNSSLSSSSSAQTTIPPTETDTSSNTNSNSNSNAKDIAATNCDVNKKIQKQKRSDEFSCTWAMDLMKNYEPDIISNSPKMEIFFCILRESIYLGDRILLFSQSLLTLNLIEGFLKATFVPGGNSCWTRNISYFRLDGSTSSQEREKLVNEFNTNPSVKLFLISTRAGSLGINLTGANRVIIFDASWNPCHDTQAVYRIYRYGQRKPCYVYRIVMDKCLEKKIYDRQIKKQGMSYRVVDECNPEAHLSLKEVTNLCHDYDSEDEFPAAAGAGGSTTQQVEANTTQIDGGGSAITQQVDGNEKDELTQTIKKEDNSKEASDKMDEEEPTTPPTPAALAPTKTEAENGSLQSVYADPIINKIIEYHKNDITKEPFFHESLLVDRKDRKLSQAEKRQAHRSYELEKKASNNQKLNYTTNKIQYKIVRNDGTVITRPVASIRPMQSKKTPSVSSGNRTTRWIPAEVWQRQGMTAQEMTLPLDVVIPTNSVEKSNIILKAGQRVMVLKSAKGIYMQLDSGKIIAIRTTAKAPERDKDSKSDVIDITSDCDSDVPKKATDAYEKQTKPENKLATTTATVNEKDTQKHEKENAQIEVTKTYSANQTKAGPKFNDFQRTELSSQQLPQNRPITSQQQQQPLQQEPHPGHEIQKEQTQQQQQQQQQQQFLYNLPQSSSSSSSTHQHHQQHQQLVKHQSPFITQSSNTPQHQNFNLLGQKHPSLSQTASYTSEGSLPENLHLQNRDTAHTHAHTHPSQYYDYYDNSKSAVPCNYQLNDYSPYGHFNYSPYHSHFYSSAAYGGTAPPYINTNAFPRHWNSSTNPPLSNERLQSSGLMGNGCQQTEWPSQ